MKLKIWGLLLIVSMTITPSWARSLVSAVDTKEFPKLKIGINSKVKLDAKSITIIENGEKCNFKFNTNNRETGVFILIESSAVTHGEGSRIAIQKIQEGITSYCKNADPNINFAFGYYNRSKITNKALNLLSDSFHPLTNQDFEIVNKLAGQAYIKSKWTDLYKAIYESLDWMKDRGKNYQEKLLIVIGTGKALSESPIRYEECIKRAREHNIKICTIGVESDDRYAFDNFKLLVEKNPNLFVKADNSEIIDTAIGNYIGQSNQYRYTVSFETKNRTDGRRHDIKLNINGNLSELNYTAPKQKNFLQKYLFPICGSIVVVVIMLLTISLHKKKKRKKAELKTQVEQADKEKISLENNGDTLTGISSAIDAKNQNRRTTTQITSPPSSITIINNGKTETIGIVKGITSFGRSKTNNIVIDNETVSGNHFTLDFNGIDCILSNLSSTNGTLVNGIKQNSTAIYAGDAVKAGTVEIYFK